MKKILLILLAFVIVAGCSQAEEQDTENTSETEEQDAIPETDEESAVTDEGDSGKDETAETDVGTKENGDSAKTDTAQSEEIIAIAEEFIGQLAEEQFEAATAHFDKTMKEQLPPEALDELWVTLQDQIGTFIDQEYASTEEADGYQIVVINGLFEGSDVMFTVTFDAKQQIAGFFVQ